MATIVATSDYKNRFFLLAVNGKIPGFRTIVSKDSKKCNACTMANNPKCFEHDGYGKDIGFEELISGSQYWAPFYGYDEPQYVARSKKMASQHSKNPGYLSKQTEKVIQDIWEFEFAQSKR